MSDVVQARLPNTSSAARLCQLAWRRQSRRQLSSIQRLEPNAHHAHCRVGKILVVVPSAICTWVLKLYRYKFWRYVGFAKPMQRRVRLLSAIRVPTILALVWWSSTQPLEQLIDKRLELLQAVLCHMPLTMQQNSKQCQMLFDA